MNHLAARILPIITLTIIAISISTVGWSQTGNVVYNTNRHTKNIDRSEYSEIKGSPYFYDEWPSAKILGADGKFYDFAKVNFNGLTNELEEQKDGVIQDIISTFYIKVIVNNGTNKDTFLRGIHHGFGRDLVCLLYEGEKVKFIRTFEVRIDQSVVHRSMMESELEKFVPRTGYYFILDGTLTKIRLKKKNIIDVLSYESEIEKYLKKVNNRLKSESDMIQLLKYYEDNIALQND